ncbi:MAG TPA: MiaB/RimO family radical SAM methylthiotransferase [Phycisphaerae bacterium]|nr:MiaB/RimO family radical SAM methylthiotransferase [Phycisphaerae bacterium]HNU46756.1 MiaB/RimO family radical SAM methylthiotransferase [Phycisphaerae bacterium]
MGAKYRVTSLGCKVNQYEAQHLREALEGFGLTPAGPGEPPDLAVVNTCAVTSTAARKSRQAIRRAAACRTPVLVVGCSTPGEAERLRRLPGVCAVLGHDVPLPTALHDLLVQKLGFEPPGSTRAQEPLETCVAVEHPAAPENDGWMMPETRQGTRQEARRRAQLTMPIISPPADDVKSGRTLDASIRRFDGHQRAFLKVQDGCDANCTYCIIPKLRPVLRWKPIPRAVQEVADLVAAGHREIVVSGIFLGAYGRATARAERLRETGRPLADLVAALAQVPGLARLRLSSLEPGDVDEALLAVLAGYPACVPHLHLPLQSGSARTLRRMGRQYGPGDYLDLLDRVRCGLDRPALTTDVIVGFPGESEEDFAATLQLAERAGFVKIHAFPFSPRAGTAAARRSPDFVDGTLVRTRMARLAELEASTSLAFRRQFVGRTERVLVERRIERPGQPPVCVGHADRYFPVEFTAGALEPGAVVSVCIEHVDNLVTRGRLEERNDECRSKNE